MALIKGNDLNNTLVGTPNNDSIYGYEGNDQLAGRAGNDYLEGGAGGDTLNGESGIDTLIGGLGNDAYIADSIMDMITEGGNAGTDIVRSSVSYTLGDWLNNLTLTGTSAINGTGNALNNIITGNGVANVLNGRGGTDTLMGGLGNDIYIVDNPADQVIEGSTAGNDTVRSFIDWALGDNLNNLTLLGTNPISGVGNDLNNIIAGNAADNYLLGYGGNDQLLGLGGNDYLEGVFGTDTLNGGVGNDTLLGTSDNDSLDGGSGEDFLLGGEENDRVNGGGGADDLVGSYGNDSLNGGAGNDYLDGAGFEYDDTTGAQSTGVGEVDTLTGGIGSDSFDLWYGSGRLGIGPNYDDYNAATTGLDDYALITDFNPDEDVIQLTSTEGFDEFVEVNYSLGASPSSLPAGTGLFVDRSGETSELIAILQNLSPSELDLNASYFSYYS